MTRFRHTIFLATQIYGVRILQSSNVPMGSLLAETVDKFCMERMHGYRNLLMGNLKRYVPNAIIYTPQLSDYNGTCSLRIDILEHFPYGIKR